MLALVLLVDAAFAATFLVALQALSTEAGGGWESVAGYALASFGLAKLILQSFSGLLADRWSPERAIMAGLALCLAAALGMAAADGVAPFAALGAVYGAGSAVLWPALYSRAAQSTDGGGRSRLVAALALTTGAAVGVAVLGGSFLVDYTSPRLVLSIAALALGVALALSPFLLGGSRRGEATTSAGPQSAPHLPVTASQRAAVAAIVLAQATAVAGLVPMIGTFAVQQLGVELHVAVLYLAPAGIAALAGLTIATRVPDRIGRPVVIGGGLGFACFGSLLLAASETPTAAAGAAALLAFGYGAAFPALGATMMDYAGSTYRGTIVGWFMSAEGTGHALGPALAGVLVAAAGVQSVIIGAGALFAVGAALSTSLALLLPARRLTGRSRSRGELDALGAVE